MDLLFPPRRACPFCGSFHPNAELCDQCQRMMSDFSGETVCTVCGRFFGDIRLSGRPGRTAALTCRECRETPRCFALARAAGPYEGVLKEAVHKLKYHNNRRLAAFLALYMLRAAAANPLFSQVQGVVPVPMSPGRLRERGFNQAELLAKEVAGGLGLPLWKAVSKIKETPTQTSLDQIKRKSNLSGAFSVTQRKMIERKTLLLVDDVITTGNTMDSVSRIMLEFGAVKVVALAASSGRTFNGCRP